MRTFAKLLVTSAALAAPALALAQDRATQFVAVTGPQRESVPGGVLLVAAYGLVWLILFGVVFRTAMVQSSAVKDLARLEGVLAAKTAAAKQDAVPAEAATEKAP